MIIECQDCAALVDAEELKSYETFHDEIGSAFKFSFCKCPKCDSPILTMQEDYGPGFEYDEPRRIYPPDETRINPMLPETIQNSFSEALLCFKAKAFTATALMCRKTLESICSEHGINEGNLYSSLKKMKEEEIIESRLYEWADALRISGNEAAHDTNISMSAQDARDIVEFTKALLEYVFTFRDKFEEFKNRRDKKEK